MQVKIDTRRDYELHVKSTVDRLEISNKKKAVVRKIAMLCFDEGLKFARGNLKIEVEI